MRILLTGGAGFIGHHVAEHFLRHTDAEIVFLDRLDTSGNLNRISQSDNWEKHKTRCRFVHHDLRAPINTILSGQIGRFDAVLHLAASTHIDRSITDPVPFVYDNVVGTANILEFARWSSIDQFVQFSTDEVFGPAPLGTLHRETDRFAPGNPYSATKAGAELLAFAYHNTYNLPVKVVHVMNVFGERQHPEKFVPLVMSKVLRGETVSIHAAPDGKTIGSRFYIHARNVAAAVQFVMEKGVIGGSYNVVGEREVDNLEMALLISHYMGIGLEYEMTDACTNRPGHDLRYALDGSKMAAMGWRLPITFERSLEKTVRWTMAHPEWLRR